MNDLIFINNLEDSQRHRSHRVTSVPSSSPAQAEGKTADSYVEGSNASCSVYRLGAGSTSGFWGLFFSLFSSD
jgi:hypothetical protein